MCIRDRHQIVQQLDELLCFAIEIRYFYPVSYHRMEQDLQVTRHSRLENIEVLFEYSDDFKLDNVLSIKEKYPALKKMIISKSYEDTVYNSEDLLIVYTTENVIDERSCGVTNELYCIAETQLFIESIHFNSCLNKKISVDRSGLIKNCPSMRKSFGHITTTKLKDVLKEDSFRKIWKISKDQVEVCSDCELRYVCQDCRAYIEDYTNIYSKPLKCKYNPYE
jgi:SPASM domain peptide maturase of grasp-with-spasm system